MNDDTEVREFYQDGAAITEYDGGLLRYDAEFYAWIAVWRYCHRTNAAPPTLGYCCVLERHFTTETPREPGEKNA
jgi:hypothetical protein